MWSINAGEWGVWSGFWSWVGECLIKNRVYGRLFAGCLWLSPAPQTISVCWIFYAASLVSSQRHSTCIRKVSFTEFRMCFSVKSSEISAFCIQMWKYEIWLMFGLNFAKVVGPLKRSNDLHRRRFHFKDGDEMKEVRLWETWKRHARHLFKRFLSTCFLGLVMRLICWFGCESV